MTGTTIKTLNDPIFKDQDIIDIVSVEVAFVLIALIIYTLIRPMLGKN